MPWTRRRMFAAVWEHLDEARRQATAGGPRPGTEQLLRALDILDELLEPRPPWWVRLSYAVRPYDGILDRRRWCWQRRGACRYVALPRQRDAD